MSRVVRRTGPSSKAASWSARRSTTCSAPARRRWSSARGYADLVLIALDGDGTRVQGAHDVNAEPGRHDNDAVHQAGHRRLGLDGQVEVAPRQVEHVPRHLEPDPGQSWKGAPPAGHGP